MNRDSRRRARAYRAAFLALTAVGALRIVLASSAYFQTSDEGAHIRCGLLWAAGGHDFFCLDQPPLARVAAALPLLAGGALSGLPGKPRTAADLDAALSGNYERTLGLARLGVLPFFIAASVLVWTWTRRSFGDPAAFAAVFLFQGLPLVLAHAGLVTTDMAAAALVPSALAFVIRWLEDPSPKRGLFLGVAAGLAILAKHSALPFLLAGSLPIAVVRAIEGRGVRPSEPDSFRKRLASLALAGVVCFFVLWAGYRFSMTPSAVASGRPHSVFRALRIDRLVAGHPSIRETLDRIVEAPMPLGDFVRGARLVMAHNTIGHPAMFLGEVRETGWWQFFPVLTIVKTPIPFLIFAAAGCVLLLRGGGAPAWKRLAPPLAAAGIILLCIASRIDIGLRHALPAFTLLAIPAGVGLHALASASKRPLLGPLAVAGLVAWFVTSSARAHPDYLPYFNELAGDHPERITVDSDLDWGQDIRRLFSLLRQFPSGKLWYACVGCSYFGRAGALGVPDTPAQLEELEPYRRVSGLVAVDEWAIAVKGEMERRRVGARERGFDWLREFPFQRIGRSLRLYRVPER